MSARTPCAPSGQAVRKRSVVIAGHRTSLSLEDAFWRALKTAAAEQGLSVNALIEGIDRTRDGNLSSAVRVYLLERARRGARNDRAREPQKETAVMAKGYWIAHVDVTDPEAYKKYVAANAEAFAKYGARFLVRGGNFEAVEGSARARHVVIEFPDYDAALACYRSPEYQRALAFRTSASDGEIIVIEGYDGPQPGAA